MAILPDTLVRVNSALFGGANIPHANAGWRAQFVPIVDLKKTTKTVTLACFPLPASASVASSNSAMVTFSATSRGAFQVSNRHRLKLG